MPSMGDAVNIATDRILSVAEERQHSENGKFFPRSPVDSLIAKEMDVLTDIFAARYAAVSIWPNYGEPERRLLVQAFRIVKEQIFPYWTDEGKERQGAAVTWTAIHDKLAMELGLNELSARGYFQKVNLLGNEHNQWHALAMPFICQKFVCAQYPHPAAPDAFIKDRLSFIEIAFRDKESQLAQANAELPAKIAKAALDAKRDPPRGHIRVGGGDPADAMMALSRLHNESFAQSVKELNARFQQAGARLNYHNGFIQLSDDQQIQQRIDTPFWELVKEPKWKNVDADIKAAFDLRDTCGRDPAFYAARALESAIKIISDEKGWSHGGERSAHNYIDNLFAKKNGFIMRWEHDSLKAIFTDIRNPFGHGPGSADMPALTAQQTDWALAACMSWVRSLIGRM